MASSWSWVTWTKVVPTRRCTRLELALHLPAQRHVEGAQRLVEQQDRGLDHERPRQGHALPLAAGELVDAPTRRSRRGRPAPARPRPLPRALAPRHAAHGQAEADIAGDGEVREQRVVLEHGRGRPPRRRHRRHVGTVDQHRARTRDQEPAQDREQRGLAAARTARAGRRRRRPARRGRWPASAVVAPKRCSTPRSSRAALTRRVPGAAAPARPAAPARSRRRTPASPRRWSPGSGRCAGRSRSRPAG